MKKKNTLLIVILILFAMIIVPWGDIYDSMFNTAESEEDIIKIARREILSDKNEDISIIGSFGYDGAFEGKYAPKKAYWLRYGEKIAIIEFAEDDEKLVYDGYHKPMKRGNDCYSEVLFNGYTFMSINEKLATFMINGEKIAVDSFPFVYYHKDAPSAVQMVTTEYYFLDKDGNEL